MTDAAEKRLRVFLGDADAAGETRVTVYREDVRDLLDEVTRLRCVSCGGTGRKVIGEHETLTNEWVLDYGPCDHKVSP